MIAIKIARWLYRDKVDPLTSGACGESMYYVRLIYLTMMKANIGKSHLKRFHMPKWKTITSLYGIKLFIAFLSQFPPLVNSLSNQMLFPTDECKWHKYIPKHMKLICQQTKNQQVFPPVFLQIEQCKHNAKSEENHCIRTPI